MDPKVFDEAIEELHAFIEDNSSKARTIATYAPKTYSIKAGSKVYSEAWRQGFHRCLAELDRIAKRLPEEGADEATKPRDSQKLTVPGDEMV